MLKLFMLMIKNFNWKPYYIGCLIITIITTIIDYKMGIGYAIGSLFYFVNDKLNLKKFPRLDATGKAVGSMLLIMAVQGILVLVAGIGTWFIGKLVCFIACFVGLVLPTIYFFVLNIIKK